MALYPQELVYIIKNGWTSQGLWIHSSDTALQDFTVSLQLPVQIELGL